VNRFERVIQILDASVGGPEVSVSFHGAFWRGITRDQFISKKVFGLEIISVGQGAASNLVKALKGEAPFGADLPSPPLDATFSRMPAGLAPVPPHEIAFIERWIDEGCPEGAIEAPSALQWRRTSAPVSSSRTDDIWFLDPDHGFAVNSDAKVLRTSDGGTTWTEQQLSPGVYLRCVAFANSNVGWIGTLTRAKRLFRTTDGGATWSAVTGLPDAAPVAVCGLSVPAASVVYAAGTNRPNDVPRMMKTTDGGATWGAWDMSSHASILIDTFFTDELNGWVVGGKADQPTPTTRDRLKPVVLQTADGGVTWTNRLAGREAEFPFGEWGWKIQFLDASVGFVSLENFHAGAILKTTDGGRTWKRLPINDAQSNANLEGIGFVDANNGWVGGWGSADFTAGFSSATSDGGQTWRNANEIGRFLNRFRFFGNPVSVGYASGDTVYKYSREPVVPAFSITSPRQRALLPVAEIVADAFPVAIPLDVPGATRRLSLAVWDRFGNELGTVLDETKPASGPRIFSWAGRDGRGDRVATGDYIVRVVADDEVASSIVTLRKRPTPHAALQTNPAARHQLAARPLATLMAPQQDHDLAWLKEALQLAVQLELGTLPPYLLARWTIEDTSHPCAVSINEIRGEEMSHFGLACNLLVAIGGTPLIADPGVVPVYPGPLPGGIQPGLIVRLARFSKEQVGVFMQIERPQGNPVATFTATEDFDSIGEFYNAIKAAFRRLAPVLDVSRQLENPDPIGIFKIDTLDKVVRAIDLINLQGEGSSSSPEEKPGDLAHYYRFGEMYHLRELVGQPGNWSFTGAVIEPPRVWPMADIPAGGYLRENVPDIAIAALLEKFDREYSNLLRTLESAWQHGDNALLDNAVGIMLVMGRTGRQLVTKRLPDGSANYGPCFRLVPP
jgi:photosystem II stability/assembly factor-like uncharacterized protein